MSRKQQIIDSYGGAQGISRLPRDQQQQIYYQLVDAENADALEANRQAEKQAKGSLGGDLAQIGGSIGGMYLGQQVQQVGSSIFGGGGAGVGSAGAAGGASGGAAGAGAASGGASAGAAGSAGATSGAAGAGSAGGAGAGSGIGGSLGSLGGVPVLPAAAAIAGTYMIDRGVSGLLGDKKNKPAGLAARGLASGVGWPIIQNIRKPPEDPAGRAALALFSGGISEIARPFFRKSTKDYQKERWGDLKKKGIANIDAAFGANHAKDDDGIWDSGKYAGQKWSFEKASDLAKDDPTHFQHVLGNYQVGGDQYAKMSDAQQKEFTRQMVAAGNYKSDKGDILAKDDKKAQEILQGVLSTMQNKPTPANNNQGSPGRRPEQRQEQKKKKTEESAANLSKLWGYMK